MLLALTLTLVVVILLDRACALLCARWERSGQVILFPCTLRQRRFLALVKVPWEILRVVSRVGPSTFVTVWLPNALLGASFREVWESSVVTLRPRAVNCEPVNC